MPGFSGHQSGGLNICFVLPGFSADESDWCIPAIRNLVADMALRHRVTVYTLHYPFRRGEYRVFGVDVRCLSDRKEQGLRRIALWRELARRVAREHAARPFDLVHAFWASETAYVASRAALRLQLPLVASLGGGELARFPAERYGSQLSATQRWLVRAALRRADAVTAGSGWVAGHVPPRYAGKVSVVPLGVDTAMFVPGPRRRGRRLAASASMIALKDYPTLLRAVALARREMPDLTLEVAGDGVEREAIERLTDELALRSCVRFHGLLPHDRMPQFYRDASLMLHASLWESQGMAILEALATGMPVIATGVGIAAELPGRLVRTVRPRDAEMLARAIVESLADSSHADAAFEGGPAIVASNYAIASQSAAFEGLYAMLLTGRGSSGPAHTHRS